MVVSNPRAKAVASSKEKTPPLLMNPCTPVITNSPMYYHDIFEGVLAFGDNGYYEEEVIPSRTLNPKP